MGSCQFEARATLTMHHCLRRNNRVPQGEAFRSNMPLNTFHFREQNIRWSTPNAILFTMCLRLEPLMRKVYPLCQKLAGVWYSATTECI
jgi:hypothetical protein